MYHASFTLWAPHLGLAERLPHALPTSITRIFFALSVISVIHEDVPRLAGPSPVVSINDMDAAAATIASGEVYIANHVGVSTLMYGSTVDAARMILRIHCMEPSAPLFVEIDMATEPGNDGEDLDQAATTFSVIGTGKDAVEGHPLLGCLLDFFGATLDEMKEMVELELFEGTTDTPVSRLQDFIEDEDSRTSNAVQFSLKTLRAVLGKEGEEAKQQAKRDARRLERQVESLGQELATAKATSDRQRLRADQAERQLRTSSRNSPIPVGQLIATTTPSSNDQHEVLQQRNDALTLENAQLGRELDSMREQLHQARHRHETIAAPTADHAQVAVGAEAIPTTFAALPSWIGAHLDSDRIQVHPKALRAARKSVFRDPPLVYRCLRALNDFYWPMRKRSDPKATQAWESFLHSERLSCGHTGAALDDHRTSDSYQVTFQGQRYPMDSHIQGSSSRKEEDAFRLYFHWSNDHRLLIGHFPSHLRNSHS